MVTVLSPFESFSSQVVSTDTTYIIRDVFDIQTSTVILPSRCILRFEGGRLLNGTLHGSETRIDNPSNDIIFERVFLTSNYTLSPYSGWRGTCHDEWFFFEEGEPADIPSNPHPHYDIVHSVCQFEHCVFSHRTYYINFWRIIHLRPFGVTICGNGTVFILPSHKGEKVSGWGNLDQYSINCLFEKNSPAQNSGEKDGVMNVSDLTILDNDSLFDFEGDTPSWGESIDYDNFTIYCIFRGSGSSVHFNNIYYDGAGGLWADYNYHSEIKRVIIDNCDIKTAQFGFELQNVWRSDLANQYPFGGRCDQFLITRCRLYNYSANHFVGPLSVVISGDDLRLVVVKKLIIEHSHFESEFEANLELGGCESISIWNNVFLSTQCSSELLRDNSPSHQPINLITRIFNNVFDISDNIERADAGLKIITGNIDFIHNILYVDFSRLSSGGITVRSYGEDHIANFVNNTFVIKRSDLAFFKSLLYYENVVMNLSGNEYSFQDGISQGYEVSVGGNSCFYNLDIEDDPRFMNIYGADYFHWAPIPAALKTPEGVIKIGETLSLDDMVTIDSMIEIDLKAFASGLGSNDTSDILSFRIHENGETVGTTITVQSYFGTVLIKVGSTVYSSASGTRYALPKSGFDNMGNELGNLRIVFWNESNDNTTNTKFLLFINNFLVDVIALPLNLFLLNNPVVSSVNLYGSPFLRIKYYRVLKYGRIVRNPKLADRLTKDSNNGYPQFGTTTARPLSPETGYSYFDTCFGKPVFFTGSGWVDASGAST